MRETGPQPLRSVVHADAPLAERLLARLPPPKERVEGRDAFLEALTTVPGVAFVDRPRLEDAAVVAGAVPVVAVLEDALAGEVASLAAHRFLAHVINDALIDHEMARHHLHALVENLSGTGRDLMHFLGPRVEGRIAQLTRASHRQQRVERLGEYLEARGVGARTALLVRDVAEELLTNAFYDAPVAGGLFDAPVSRTEDLELPLERALEISYGVRGDDLSFVRVRDRFGALPRERLIEVLARCARPDVQLDERMGGAGLGLWRIFSVASFVAMTVVPGVATDVLVGVLHLGPSMRPSTGRRPQAIHLFFEPGSASGQEPRAYSSKPYGLRSG